MLANLIESGRVARPAAGHGVASAVIHGGLVLGLVLAGPGGPRAGGAPAARESVAFARFDLTFLPAPAPPPAGRGAAGAPPHAAPRGARRAAGPALAPLPAFPVAALEGVALDVAPSDALDVSGVLPDAGEFRPSAGGALHGVLDYASGGGGLDDPLPVYAVERPPVPYADNPRPEYPPSLLRLGLQGHVEVQFVVDTSGRADARSLRVLRAAHALFTREVRRALPRMRFLAAERGGRKVSVIVSQLYTFEVR